MQSMTENTQYAKAEKKVKYNEVFKKRVLRDRRLKKEVDRYIRAKSLHSGKLSHRVRARQAFVTADESVLYDVEHVVNLPKTLCHKHFGKLKRKPGHRDGYINKEMAQHLFVMDPEFSDHIRVQVTAEDGRMKKPFEGFTEDPFQYQGELVTISRRINSVVEEPTERDMWNRRTPFVDTTGEPLDYFSLVA